MSKKKCHRDDDDDIDELERLLDLESRLENNHSILPERKNLKVNISLTDFRTVSDIVGQPPSYRLVYRVDIFNSSKMSVKLVARKWTSVDNDFNMSIIEAENIFNTQPILPPRGVFTYGGIQDFKTRPLAIELRIAGVDQLLTPFISTPYIFTAEQLKPRSN